MHEPFKLVRCGEPWSILWNWIEIIPTYPKQNIVQTKEKIRDDNRTPNKKKHLLC